MKGLIKYSVLMASLLTALLSYGQNSPKNSPMVFDHLAWDFGRINEVDGVVKHAFEFVNKGKEPLVIQEVAVSCGCTTPTFSKRPVMPGEKGTIEIAYDPKNRPGGFSKDIYVIGSRNINGTVLVVKGDVVESPRTIEEEYPIELTSGLRLASRSENIGYISLGTTMSRMIGYANDTDKELKVSTEVKPTNNYFRVTIAPTIAPRSKGEMILTYDLREVDYYGLMPANIYFTVNGRKSEIPFSITARGVDNFKGADIGKSPKCELSSTYQNLGGIKKGGKLSREFTITNKGKTPLIVRNVQPQEGVSVILASGTVIEAGRSLIFTVKIDTSTYELGKAFRNIAITTNDPERPFREIRLVANIN